MKNNRKNPIFKNCHACQGMPWRRGEKTGDFCRECGQPYSDEEPPTIEDFMFARNSNYDGL